MELVQLSLPLLFAFLLLISLILKNYKYSKHKLPPGPKKIPFIGNLHQLTGSLPHRALNELAKKHGPIMHLQLGELPLLIISSAKAAAEVMKNQDLAFVDRPIIKAVEITSFNGSSLVFAPYGEYWKQLRKFCTFELLSSKHVLSYRSLREEGVENLVKLISSFKGAPINLSEMIFSFNSSIICRAAFGKKCDEVDEFIKAAKEAVQLGGGFDVADLFPSYKFLHRISKARNVLEKSHIKVDRILNKIIDHHREKRGYKEVDEKDLVDVLLKQQENPDPESPITKNSIKAVLREIFIAGTETPSRTMEWAISELIKNPQTMKKAQAEVRSILKGKSKINETDIEHMNYLKLVIKETLRLHPPLPLLLPREARIKCKINDYDIAKKTKVIVNAWAIGRDPKYWDNPECFEPDRFKVAEIDFKGANFEYIPFGAGRRMCPGMLFGIANIELPLAQLLYHFDWKLPNGTKPEELDMSEAFGVTVSRKNELNLIATSYYP